MKQDTDLESMDNFFTWFMLVLVVCGFIFGAVSCTSSVVKYEDEKTVECEAKGGILIRPKYGGLICVKEA